MILVVTLLLLAAVLVFVGYPLLRPSEPEAMEQAMEQVPPPATGQRERLLAEREHVLATLKELEFEHGIGNLSDEDYAELQAPQRRKAVAILRELDSSGVDSGDTAGASARDEPDVDARLEAEIARERARLAGTTGMEPAAQNSNLSDDAGVALPLCPVCHTAHAATARFCAGCGHRLRENGEDGVAPIGSAPGTREAREGQGS